MAEVYNYRCEKCGFSVGTEGPSSRGMMYTCKCFKCNDCGHIGDSMTSHMVGYYNDEGQSEWEDTLPECSKCNSKNISEWNFKCPTCDGELKRIETGLMKD